MVVPQLVRRTQELKNNNGNGFSRQSLGMYENIDK